MCISTPCCKPSVVLAPLVSSAIGHLGTFPLLDLKQQFFQLNSEPHQVYNGLYRFQNVWNRQRRTFYHASKALKSFSFSAGALPQTSLGEHTCYPSHFCRPGRGYPQSPPILHPIDTFGVSVPEFQFVPPLVPYPGDATCNMLSSLLAICNGSIIVKWMQRRQPTATRYHRQQPLSKRTAQVHVDWRLLLLWSSYRPKNQPSRAGRSLMLHSDTA